MLNTITNFLFICFITTIISVPVQSFALTINTTANTPILNSVLGFRPPLGEEINALNRAIGEWELRVKNNVELNLFFVMQPSGIIKQGIAAQARMVELKPLSSRGNLLNTSYKTARFLLNAENLFGAKHDVVRNLPLSNELEFIMDPGVEFKDANGNPVANENVPIFLTAAQQKVLLGKAPDRIDIAPDFYTRVGNADPLIRNYVIDLFYYGGANSVILLQNLKALLPELNLKEMLPAAFALLSPVPNSNLFNQSLHTRPIETLMASAIIIKTVFPLLGRGAPYNLTSLTTELQVLAGLDGTGFVYPFSNFDYDSSDGIGEGVIDWFNVLFTNGVPDLLFYPKAKYDLTGFFMHPIGHSLGIVSGNAIPPGHLALGDLFRIEENSLGTIHKAKDYRQLPRMISSGGPTELLSNTVFVYEIPSISGSGALKSFPLVGGFALGHHLHIRPPWIEAPEGNGYISCPVGVGPNALFTHGVLPNDRWTLTKEDLLIIDFVGWNINYSGVANASVSDCISGN